MTYTKCRCYSPTRERLQVYLCKKSGHSEFKRTDLVKGIYSHRVCFPQWLTPALLLIFNLRCLQMPVAYRCPLRTDVWAALQTESIFWQMWGKLPFCSGWTLSSVLTPFPFGGESSCHEGGRRRRPDFPNKSSSPGDACGFSFLTQHPWGSDSRGWEFLFLCFPSSLSGDRDQSPMFFLWLSTCLLGNLSWCDSGWVNICLWWPAGPNLVRRVASKHWLGVDKL